MSNLRSLTPGEVREFFSGHRTVRQYRTEGGQPIPLPADHLEAVLYAAQRASTHSTAQIYTIIQLESPEVRAKMAELTKNPHIASAGAAFVMCADLHRLEEFLALRGVERGDWPAVGTHFALGDAALAGQNLLTAAEMLGYQGCWIGGVINHLPEIVEFLALPAGVLPFAALTVGLSDEDTPYRPRLQQRIIVHTDHYREVGTAELEENLTLMNPIADRPGKPGDWARLLALYWGKGGQMEAREGHYTQVRKEQGLD